MDDLDTAVADQLPDLAELYRDLHAHPELSYQEHRTAAAAAGRLTALGYDVTTGIGGTGVVGLLRNGTGPVVLLRADMDALPVQEETGLPYASKVWAVDRDGHHVPVMHACAHDMHVTCLAGAAAALAATRHDWRGTVMAVFQPAEEGAAGATAMVEDGLFERCGRPDVCLGQHVVARPAGTVHYRSGPMMATSDALRVTLFGRGAHGSRPEASVDPVVMAAALVMRLQTIVSREVGPADSAVVTVGALRAGMKENIIPETAELLLTIRAFDPAIRRRLLSAIERIARAEAAASDAPRAPEIEIRSSFPLTVNDEAGTHRVADVLRGRFGEDRVMPMDPVFGSEDFSVFGTAAGVPSVFWFLGGTDPQAYAAAEAAGRVDQDIHANHSPYFAPLVAPTLGVGVQTLVTAARAWLS